MSAMRPTLRTTTNPATVSNGTAYLMILNAVNMQRGLLHGKLKNASGHFCAIGCYFEVNAGTVLLSSLIDEVAAFNDSMPNLTQHKRKIKVAQWLRWKLGQMNYPGYRNAKAPK